MLHFRIQLGLAVRSKDVSEFGSLGGYITSVFCKAARVSKIGACGKSASTTFTFDSFLFSFVPKLLEVNGFWYTLEKALTQSPLPSRSTRLNTPSRLDDGFPRGLFPLRHLARVITHLITHHHLLQQPDLLPDSRILGPSSHGSRKDSHPQRGSGFLRHAFRPGR